MEIEGLVLANTEKLNRAIYGAVGKGGEPDGHGVGEDADPADLIAAYDRLLGLIQKDGNKVKSGCFWDFKKRQKIEKPKLIFLIRGVDGNVYEIKDGEKVPLAVQAAQQAAEGDVGEASEEKPKGKKSKKSVEDEE